MSILNYFSLSNSRLADLSPNQHLKKSSCALILLDRWQTCFFITIKRLCRRKLRGTIHWWQEDFLSFFLFDDLCAARIYRGFAIIQKVHFYQQQELIITWNRFKNSSFNRKVSKSQVHSATDAEILPIGSA